jgi:hypothetical protein
MQLIVAALLLAGGRVMSTLRALHRAHLLAIPDEMRARARNPGLRDPASSRARAARILARAHPAVAHHLWGARKARELTDFRDDRDRRDQRDPAQRLEGLDHRPHRRQGRLHRLVDRALEPFDAIGDMIDFVQIVQPGGLLRRLLELNLSDPRQVSLRPRRHGRRGTPPVPQQEFPEAVARATDLSSPLLGRAPNRAAPRARRPAPIPP